MADVRSRFISLDKGIDYVLDNFVLEDDEGMDTAVILSLFTDARANDDDVIPGGSPDKRGAWTDTYSDIDGDVFGSHLWLLERAKLTQDTVKKVRQYCEEALNWFIRDGIAKAINVTTSITRHHPIGIIGAQIDIVRNDDTIERYKFDQLWSAV